MRNIFICAVTALVAVLSLAAAPALADDGNRVSQLKVAVWPEYDNPSVLVLIEGTLADPTNLPRDVSVLVPPSAQGIIATFENSDGSLAPEQSYQSEKQEDGWTRITYSVKTASYHVEYYDNALQGSTDKQLDFKFRLTAPADKVTLEFQQPLKATNFNVTPATQTTRNESGFTYYDMDYAGASAGQTLGALVKYTKTDANPSVLPAPSPAAVQNKAPAAASIGSWSSVYVMAGIVVLGLAAFIGIIMIRQRGQPAMYKPVARNSPRGGRRRVTKASQFCTLCGHAITSADNFCPQCGARRRAV